MVLKPEFHPLKGKAPEFYFCEPLVRQVCFRPALKEWLNDVSPHSGQKNPKAGSVITTLTVMGATRGFMAGLPKIIFCNSGYPAQAGCCAIVSNNHGGFWST